MFGCCGLSPPVFSFGRNGRLHHVPTSPAHDSCFPKQELKAARRSITKLTMIHYKFLTIDRTRETSPATLSSLAKTTD